jgi:hypothetical protein
MFDIPHDEVQALTQKFDIGYQSDYVHIDSNSHILASFKNYYYYGTRPGPSKMNMKTGIHLVLTHKFFERIKIDYETLLGIFESDSTVPIMFYRSDITCVDKLCRLLNEVKVREIIRCQ